MEKYIIAAVAALLLCGCAKSENMTEKGGSTADRTISGAEELIEPVIKGAKTSVDFSSLSTECHGYGQGVILDDKNRPQGALDFNAQYGKYNACAIGEETDRIRLTFDQGYENGCTAKILDTLKEKNVKATFYILQDYAERNPELVRRMIDEGHTIGNHSVSHYSMPSLSADECREEIMGLHNYMKENFDCEMTEFRPPKGEFSELSLAVAKECGYKTVLWSFAYADWNVDDQPSESEALKKLIDAAHPGAIYLLHSVSETNTAILPQLIDALRENGWKL